MPTSQVQGLGFLDMTTRIGPVSVSTNARSPLFHRHVRGDRKEEGASRKDIIVARGDSRLCTSPPEVPVA